MVEPAEKRRKRNDNQVAETQGACGSDVIIIDDSEDDIILPATPVRSSSMRRSSRASQVVEPVSVDDDGDVMIVPVTEVATNANSDAPGPLSNPTFDDDGIQVGVLASAVVYPHARADCKTHEFTQAITNQAHALNVKHCDKCYCYVCDVEASKCSDWERHCMASDKRTAWRNLRTKKKSRPNFPLVVPDGLLPPSLRCEMSRSLSGSISGATASLNALARAAKIQSQARLAARTAAQSGPSAFGSSQGAFGAGSGNPIGIGSLANGDTSAFIPNTSQTYTIKQKQFYPPSSAPLYLSHKETRSFVIGKIDLWRPYCSHRKATFPKRGSTFSRMGWVDQHFLVDGKPSPQFCQVLMKEVFPFICNRRQGDVSNSTLNETFRAVDACLPDLNALRKCKTQRTQGSRSYTCTADKEAVAGYVEESLEEAIDRGLISIDWELIHHTGSEGTNKNGALASFHSELCPTIVGVERFASICTETDAWIARRDRELKGCSEYNSSNCCCLRGYVSLLPAAFGSSNVRVAADVAAERSPDWFNETIDTSYSMSERAPSPAEAIGTKRQGVDIGHILGRVFSLVDFADFRTVPLSIRPAAFLPKRTDNLLMKPAYRGVLRLDDLALKYFDAVCKSKDAVLSGGDSGASSSAASPRQQLFSIEGILSSPLFTVSTGYAGGSAPQPAGITVPLRGYQRESLKWMEDQESRDSISDPFWVKLTMASCTNGKVQSGSTWSPFWFCPLTGSVARFPPPRVVGGILAEEMGLGKTLLIISLISNSLTAARNFALSDQTIPDFVNSKSTLVITPVSLLEQWRSELTRMTTEGSLKVCFWYGANRPKTPSALAPYDVVLTTYSTMSSGQSSALKGVMWYRIVIDESTYTRNGSSSAMYNALMELRSRRRWAVSGTPFANNMKSLMPVMRFLGVSPLARDRAFAPMLDAFNSKLSGSLNYGGSRRFQDEERLPSFPIMALAYTLKSIMMRHVKKQKLHGQSLIDLPPSSGSLVKVNLTPQERIRYLTVEEAAQVGAKGILRSSAATNSSIVRLHADLIPVRRATSGIFAPRNDSGNPERGVEIFPQGGKMTRLVTDVQGIIDKDPLAKFVVFSEHDALKKQVASELGRAKIGCISLNGCMTATQRGRLLGSFASEPERKVLILSSKFAHGLTLTCANHVVLLEPSLSQETELQAVDRVRRIGQTRETTILTYVASKTIDERVIMLRKRKGHAPAIGLPAPSSGNEIMSHVDTFRLLYGTADVNGNPVVYENSGGDGNNP